jgi:hypothetical protein
MGTQELFDLLIEPILDHEIVRNQPADLCHDHLVRPIDSE